MRREITTSLIAVVFFTLLLGLAYPLLVTGVSQVAFPGAANGSKLELHGKVVGSKLLAQGFGGHPQYFQPRPSATGYDPSVTFFANRGPNQVSTRDFHRKQLARYLARERRYDPGLSASGVPVDAVTDSASGVDPDISVANAHIQARRVAAVRRLPLTRVLALVDRYTDGRSLGFLGEPGVNVTQLNLALDREAPTR